MAGTRAVSSSAAWGRACLRCALSLPPCWGSDTATRRALRLRPASGSDSPAPVSPISRIRERRTRGPYQHRAPSPLSAAAPSPRTSRGSSSVSPPVDPSLSPPEAAPRWHRTLQRSPSFPSPRRRAVPLPWMPPRGRGPLGQPMPSSPPGAGRPGRRPQRSRVPRRPAVSSSAVTPRLPSRNAAELVPPRALWNARLLTSEAGAGAAGCIWAHEMCNSTIASDQSADTCAIYKIFGDLQSMLFYQH